MASGYCATCGQSYHTHNDDGSCIQDEEMEHVHDDGPCCECGSPYHCCCDCPSFRNGDVTGLSNADKEWLGGEEVTVKSEEPTKKGGPANDRDMRSAALDAYTSRHGDVGCAIPATAMCTWVAALIFLAVTIAGGA